MYYECIYGIHYTYIPITHIMYCVSFTVAINLIIHAVYYSFNDATAAACVHPPVCYLPYWLIVLTVKIYHFENYFIT